MKQLFLLTLALCFWATAAAQEAKTYTQADTLKGEQIVDRYINFVNFDQILSGNMMYVETKIIDRSSPTDTMRVYHWYASNHCSRIEMHQNGKLESGYYSDGRSIFRIFHSRTRSWTDLIQSTYYDYVISLDPRGALFNWRSKGAEIVYDGETQLNGQAVDRVFVSCPNTFDRYYFFEQNSGLLFLTKEENHIYGDGVPSHNAQRVDWRGWHQFTPLSTCLLPTEESYQYVDQIVLIYRTYKLLPLDKKVFTEDYAKHQ